MVRTQLNRNIGRVCTAILGKYISFLEVVGSLFKYKHRFKFVFLVLTIVCLKAVSAEAAHIEPALLNIASVFERFHATLMF